MKSFSRAFAVALISFVPSLLLGQTASTVTSDALLKPPPGIDLWFDRSTYETFDKATVFFNAEPGSYVVVLRVTPRGALEVLYPSSPSAQAPYRSNSEARTALTFRNDAIEGIGEISAMASATPFDFSKVANGAKWNGRRLSHPKEGIEGSLSSGFFADVLGPAGTRYGIASAIYGVGVSGEAALNVAGTGFGAGGPTAQDALRSLYASCRSLSAPGNPPTSAECASDYLLNSDPRPRRGGPEVTSPTSGNPGSPSGPKDTPPPPPPPPPPSTAPIL
jgi:hypothetical protein